jgi:hypothetical protein
MQITVAPQRIFLFSAAISENEAETLAFSKKLDAFGAFNKVSSFLSRPKDEDFEIVYREKRLVPFWHLVCKSHYVFERTVNHSVALKPEVKKVTFHGKDFEVNQNAISLPMLEHCEETVTNEICIDNKSSKHNPTLQKYFTHASTQATEERLISITQEGMTVLPPTSRASALVNDQVASLIKSVQADKVFEETIEITHLDLYYHLTFAFEFLWKSKNKKAIIEIDALTSEVHIGNELFREYLGKALDPDFLFDIGADAAGMVVPGGSIAIKMAKKYLSMKKS